MMSSLKNELSRLARLSSVQSALPLIAKPLPIAAIAVGAVVAKTTGGINHIEERILGPGETISLERPQIKIRVAKSWGAQEMCVLCRLGGAKVREGVL